MKGTHVTHTPTANTTTACADESRTHRNDTYNITDPAIATDLRPALAADDRSRSMNCSAGWS